MDRASGKSPDPFDLAASGPMPVAPTVEEWAALSPKEKARRIEEINASLPLSETMSEGTQHSRAKRRAADTLEAYFAPTKQGIFVAEELWVMFPGGRVVVPDVLAVRDVALHGRHAWAVGDGGRGPDLR